MKKKLTQHSFGFFVKKKKEFLTVCWLLSNPHLLRGLFEPGV